LGFVIQPFLQNQDIHNKSTSKPNNENEFRTESEAERPSIRTVAFRQVDAARFLVGAELVGGFVGLAVVGLAEVGGFVGLAEVGGFVGLAVVGTFIQFFQL